MRKLIAFVGLVLLASCSSGKDERFCECLKVSDELNTEASKYSSGDFALDETTDEDVSRLKSLSTQKDSICAPYEILGGEELLRKKEECK